MSDAMHQDVPQKQCSKCREWKDATDQFFYLKKGSRSGLTSRCRVCVRKKWREQHPNSKPRKGDAPVPVGVKQCVACGKDLPATSEYFYVESRNQDGLRSPCIQCLKAYSESRKEAIRESKRRHYPASRTVRATKGHVLLLQGENCVGQSSRGACRTTLARRL